MELRAKREELRKAQDGGTVSMQCVYAGDLDHGERVVDTFRKFDAPDDDSVKRRRFADIATGCA